MKDFFSGPFAQRYAALADLQSGLLGAIAASSAGLFLCGVSACVDARVEMNDIQPLLDAPANTPPARLAALLLLRATRGIGGEVLLSHARGAITSLGMSYLAACLFSAETVTPTPAQFPNYLEG